MYLIYDFPNGYQVKQFLAPDYNVSDEEGLAIYTRWTTVIIIPTKRPLNFYMGKKTGKSITLVRLTPQQFIEPNKMYHPR